MLRLVECLAAAGSDEIALADTVGYANPAQIKRIFSAAASIFDGPIYAHFHDTRGLGLANVAAAVDVGITRFDASIGGLGGCPFAPGASGNIDTEDTAFLLESMGFDTGLDIQKLVALRAEGGAMAAGRACRRNDCPGRLAKDLRAGLVAAPSPNVAPCER